MRLRSTGTVGAAVVCTLAAVVWSATPPDVAAQGVKPVHAAASDKVELIIGNLPPKTSPAYTRLRTRAGGTMGQMLGMSKSEVWIVPASRVAGLTKEAERSGARVMRVGAAMNLMAPMTSNAPMSATQSGMMAMAKQSPATMGIGMMAAPPTAMVEYALTKGMNDKASGDSDIIALSVDDKTSIKVKRQSVTTEGDHYVWRGVTVDANEPATVLWWADGRMSGSLTHKGVIYAIKPFGGGMTGIVAMDPDKMPTEHAPMKPMARNDPQLKSDPLFMTGDGGSMRPRTTPMPTMPAKPSGPDTPKTGSVQQPVEITIMVAYTKKAARHYSDIRKDLIPIAVDDANQSFRKSGVGDISLRLVHTHEADYDESGAIHFDHVWRMADKGDGFMEEIPRLRDEKRADIVVLVVDDPSGCGLATRVAADAEEGYAVVHHECAAVSYSLAHEVGHIIGARHDHSLDMSSGPFPFGHGFVNGTKWRTMMSYKSSCHGCPRLPIWSNPEIKILGEPAGAAKANNARVLREQAERVARFRSSRPAP